MYHKKYLMKINIKKLGFEPNCVFHFTTDNGIIVAYNRYSSWKRSRQYF